jgi:hypothetical protein
VVPTLFNPTSKREGKIMKPGESSSIRTSCVGGDKQTDIQSGLIVVENSLALLGNGYRDCAVVFDGDPDSEPARWECQTDEGLDAFIGRVQGDLEREGRGSEEVVIHTVTGFWEGRGAVG